MNSCEIILLIETRYPLSFPSLSLFFLSLPPFPSSLPSLPPSLSLSLSIYLSIYLSLSLSLSLSHTHTIFFSVDHLTTFFFLF